MTKRVITQSNNWKVIWVPEGITNDSTPVKQVFTRSYAFQVVIGDAEDSKAEMNCTVGVTVQEIYNDKLDIESRLITKLSLGSVPEAARHLVYNKVIDILKVEGYDVSAGAVASAGVINFDEVTVKRRNRSRAKLN